jgi:hypothetical protein
MRGRLLGSCSRGWRCGMGDGPSVPLWARWGARAVPQVPWAHVRLRGADGVYLADLLGIGRGWVSVRVLVSMGYQCQVWRPADVEWETAELMTGCRGIRVELPSGEVHELARDRGEAVLWRWVARAVEVGATVDALTG